MKTHTKKFTGGRASRAEVYGLFIAAIVLVGGGVSGAIALNNTDDPTTTTSTSSNTEATSEAQELSTVLDPQSSTANGSADPGSTPGTSGSTPDASAGSSPSTGFITTAEPCPYTPAEQTYYNNIRATKQAAVDQAQNYVTSVEGWIASNTAHLEELLAAPYRPIEVFQWNPDGTPYVWRVDSNEEIAFERQRIADNQSELTRAREALQRAIADRDQIPGC